MAFEDPAKLKIDLVVGDEESNQKQIESQPVDLEPASDSSELEVPLSTDAGAHTDSVMSAPVEATLTPWKNRFAKGSPNFKDRQGRIGLLFLVFDTASILLSSITILLALMAVTQSAWSPADKITNGILLGIPVALGFALYPVFGLRTLLAFLPLKPKFLTFLRATVPLLVANTMTVWGIVLACYAMGVARVFGWVRGLETTIGPQHSGQAMAVFTLGSAGLLQLLLVLLLGISMVTYHKFFQWIDKRTLEIHGVSMGGRKAGLFGIIAGALFGFCGLYTALGAGGPDTLQFLAISTMVWSGGILTSCLFFSLMAKFRNHKPTP